MVLNLKKYSVSFLFLMGALLATHLLVYRAFPGFVKISRSNIFEIYLFLALLNSVHFVGLRWLFIKWAKYAGLLFTVLSMLKMAICVLYLWPYIFPSTDMSIALVLNFMVIYFVTLAFEVVFIAKNMTKI